MSVYSRREFVAVSAAASVGLLLPRWSLGGRGRPGPNGRLGVGIIGMGLRARELLGPLLSREDAMVVAVCDVDTRRREDGVRRVDEHYAKDKAVPGWKGCLGFNDYRELLAHSAVDAVLIATPDHWHAPQVVGAAGAKKHVYAEKPLTHTLAEGKALIDAVKKAGIVFQTGSQQRTEFGERFIQAVEHVHAGHIGRVLNINVGVGDPPKACDLAGEEVEPGLDWDRWLGPAPARAYHSDLSPRGVHGHYPVWRRYSEYSGGYLADMGAHHFDIAQWMLGADGDGPFEARPPGHPKANTGATLAYAIPDPSERSRRPLHFIATVTHGGPSGVVVVGTEGMIRVDRGELSSSPGELLKREVPEQFRLPRPGSHMNQWLDAVKACKPEAVSCGVEVGARTAAACQLLNLAYATRRAIRWNAQGWRFADETPEGLMDKERRKGIELRG